jgi:ubiquinone/menaquinone biosynthesis C-methylase UbiE
LKRCLLENHDLNNDDYMLMVGEHGAKRLKLLNEMCNKHTFKFINQYVDLKNKSILDIGCGTGIIANELAHRSLPNGSVLATDISREQLNIAQVISINENSRNINFLQISAEDIDMIGRKFDVIYCRFVLSHLKNPEIVIAKIVSLMHSDTILICEEPEDIDCLYCKPHEPIFDIWKQAMFKQVELSKSDFIIGKTLPDILKKYKIKTCHILSVQPVMDNFHLKQQLWLGIQELKTRLVESRFASESELDTLIQSLKIFSSTSNAEIGYCRLAQIIAKLE